jgi:hypothetical protein
VLINFSITTLATKLLFACLLTLTISGCSSSGNPVIYQSNYDFSQVKSYSFYTSGSDFFDSQDLSHAQRSGIEIAIEKHLDAQKLNYTAADNADIIVTYHLVTKQRQDYQSYNKVVRFCSHCLRASTWQQQNSDWQVYPGGLIIDLVDPKKNRSVWRSIYPLKFKAKDNSRELNEKVKEAVNIMLSQYPMN